MQLIHLRYKDNRLFLLLLLGERNSKHCGIISQKITDSEREKIQNHMKYLEKVSLIDRLIWFKSYCPLALRNGYREISTTNATIIGTYQLPRI